MAVESTRSHQSAYASFSTLAFQSLYKTRMSSFGFIFYDFLGLLVEAVDFIVIMSRCWGINLYDGDIGKCALIFIEIRLLESGRHPKTALIISFCTRNLTSFSCRSSSLLNWNKLLVYLTLSSTCATEPLYVIVIPVHMMSQLFRFPSLCSMFQQRCSSYYYSTEHKRIPSV